MEAENLNRGEPRFVLPVRPLESALEQFRAATQVQLLLDAGPIGLDSFYAQAKLFGNLTGPLALAEQAEHLKFTISQAVYRRNRGVRLTVADKAVQQLIFQHSLQYSRVSRHLPISA